MMQKKFDFYNELSESYDALYKQEQFNKYGVVVNNLKGYILDLGCGSGLLIEFLIKKCINFKSYVGIDNSKRLIEIARKKIREFFKSNNKNKQIILIESEAEKFNYDQLLQTLNIKKFDTIVSFTAIHHFKDLNFLLNLKCDMLIISVLKKSKRFEEITQFLKENFYVEKTIVEYHDTIYILKTKNEK